MTYRLNRIIIGCDQPGSGPVVRQQGIWQEK